MRPFKMVSDNKRPLRILVVGAGPMGQAWLSALNASADTHLVGLVDLDLDAARAALIATESSALEIGQSVSEMANRTRPDAVVNATTPTAHHSVTTESLLVGLPVLSEKPVAPSVSEALSLAAAAEVSGHLLMVSQSRRYYRTLKQFKRVVASLGDVGLITTNFFGAPHFGGFREEMDHPLLLDMAIHAFDTARYLLEDEPQSVFCEEFNPSWSWYQGDAITVATFTMRGGSRYVYTGSWCSPGLETSLNGNWRVSAEKGSAIWDGSEYPVWEAEPAISSDVSEYDAPEEIAGSLAAFVTALRTGVAPLGSVVQNIPSLVMVEAAAYSSARGERVEVNEIVERAYVHAIRDEKRPEVAEVLRGWSSALGFLGLE